MNATPAAPESEPAKPRTETSPETPTTAHNSLRTSRDRQIHDDEHPSTSAGAKVKLEDGADVPANNQAETSTTLRPAPQPSAKRRESEAGDSVTPEFVDAQSKKRKRAVSPPWTFPSVENSLVKTADGRRVSARVNANTPGVSETEDTRARSNSQPTSRSRPPSPPWKRFGADGPTSIQVDGVRKSSRVNKDLTPESKPTRTSPRQKKQTYKLENVAKSDARPASRGRVLGLRVSAEAAGAKKSSNSARPSSPSSTIKELKARIAALKPTRSFPTELDEALDLKGSKRKRSHDVVAEVPRPASPIASRKMHRHSNASLSPEVTRPSPRIKLRFSSARHIIPPPHPQARLSPPARPPRLSLYQVIEKYELREAQQPYMENERGPPGADFFRMRNDRQAAEEAEMRKRLLREAQPNGVLSRERSSFYHDERQPEPPQQYGHNDHLALHAVYFRSLQHRESTQHRNLAKKVAQEALEYWKAMHGPTEEDIKVEEDRIFRLIYKQVAFDVKAKWDLVAAHVQHLRRGEWERQEELKRQERLQRQLEWSEAMVARQRGEGDGSDADVDELSIAEDAEGETDEDDESEEENMSESESEAGSESDDGDDDAEMDDDELAEYLAQREAQPPDKRNDWQLEDIQILDKSGLDSLVQRHDDGFSKSTELKRDDTEDEDRDAEFRPENVFSEASAADQDNESRVMLLDEPTLQHSTRARRSSSATPSMKVQEVENDLSSDESVDMDSEDYDSDEDMSSSDDEASATKDEDEDEAASAGNQTPVAESSLLGFFSKTDRRQFGLPTPTTSAEGDERDRLAEGPIDDTMTTRGVAGASKTTQQLDNLAINAECQDSDGHTISQLDGQYMPEPTDGVAPPSAPHSPESAPSDGLGDKPLIPQPALLRGTLRSYQHTGLDWLTSLYRNGTNGILADEMGLGKTIQTIALLAHLAEEWQVWDTHLVIVPTSVILNWVTEFQKFLPGFRVLAYYGSAEERQIKRKGWVNDPHHENREKRGYNVVITSYNIAMQDINAIRNVQWHYLVLDEAHNIRNFNSQKWQVLIRLKTRARLMLTGTPLQNSLTELWSLLTFLTAGDDDPKHGDLEEFLSHWKEPVKEIFDRGVQTLSNESQRVVDQLHISLRPFLLRRLKSEVEKDLPKKTESVVVCKLSKRQRQLYEEYMGLASTKYALTRGSGISAGKVLMSLRRVCNHPDLFDPRPIQTSFAMEYSAVEPFGIKERIVRQLLGAMEPLTEGMLVVRQERRRKYAIKRSRQLVATGVLQRQVAELESSSTPPATATLSTCAGTIVLQRMRQREKKLQQLRDCIQINSSVLQGTPVFGSDLRELVTVQHGRPYLFTQRGRMVQKFLRSWPTLGHKPLALEHPSDWVLVQNTSLQKDVLDVDRYAQTLHDTIVRFAVCPPVAGAPLLDFILPSERQKMLRANDAYPTSLDFAHEARIRTSINFPDKRLLIYDAGKLQRLTSLLRELQSKGSRSLIFTQSTATLNVLEQFLNLLSLPYLRLDGSTHVERRQLYAAEFNRPDSRYQCMILSSRAGGVGLNLIGASSVIFYDLDWNPQMDRQCMDRAHRIGQVRDVEVYKMVSEKTIEENILRRANQKSLLDQTVIQEGHFTTDYQQQTRRDADENEDDEVAAALERFLGGGEKAVTQALESVEDREDVQAAQQARKEEHQDDVDFAERSSKGPSTAATPGPGATEGADDERKGHLDDYMIRHMEELLRYVSFVPPVARKLDKHGRDPSHRPKKKR